MQFLRRLTLVLTTIAAGLAAHGADNRTQLILRGRYLVEGVGLCADCHSPRDEKGGFVPRQWLMGSPLAFKPTVEMPWAPVAPPIAGLPTMTEDEAVRFFTTGLRPNGTKPLPPMPEFRFSEDDARAVAAYLKARRT
jgi:mono/diheme cytochrome c family protein